VKLIIDENLPARWKEFFSPHGIEALHWTEIGKAGDPDEMILDDAAAQNTGIVTQDLDFTRLLALRGSRLPSVIQLRVPCPIPEIVGIALLRVLQDHERHLMEGCLISLDLDRHRLRLLPLG
jgi:predicted nuclease of predicted toxin-antitoxin system